MNNTKTPDTNYSEKYDIFLSYRRDGGEAMAILLHDRLTQRGYTVFLDIENLNSGGFNTKLFDIIDNCKDFLLICSKDSLERCNNDDDWVRLEIVHALSKNKNIVPVMLRNFEFPEELPADIEAIRLQNGVNANNHEYFDAAVDRLAEKFLKSTPFLSVPEMSEKLRELIVNQSVSDRQKNPKRRKTKIAGAIFVVCIIALLVIAIKIFYVPKEETAEIMIFNNTEDSIQSIYIKRSDLIDWGENIVNGNPLIPGENAIVIIPLKETELIYTWDMQCIFQLDEINRTYKLESFSLYEIESIEIYMDENGELERAFHRFAVEK